MTRVEGNIEKNKEKRGQGNLKGAEKEIKC